MRTAIHISFALILAAATGCTTVHDFYGSASNLKSGGERIPPGTHLKMSVTCSGSAPSGDRYIAFHLRRESCWLVLFHQPVESGRSLQTATTSGGADAWLVRGKRPGCEARARSGR